MIKLHIDNLIKTYRERKVVNSVSLSLESGSVVGLLGPNGAGKTTTFYMTIGMIKPDKGKIFLDDEDVTNYPMYLRARKGIGYLPQEASIFRKLTVKQNMMAILEMQSISKAEREERKNTLLDELGILPNAGGYLDQSATLIEAVKIVRNNQPLPPRSYTP